MRVRIHREESARDLPLPQYATAGAAGMDLYAAISDEILLGSGGRAKIPTGISLALPEGYEGQVRPRSGLALQHGLGIVNSPGTIDSDYRGVVSVILINWGQDPVTIRRGQRIAQLVVAPVTHVEWEEYPAQSLPETIRDEGGFGHTGVD